MADCHKFGHGPTATTISISSSLAVGGGTNHEWRETMFVREHAQQSKAQQRIHAKQWVEIVVCSLFVLSACSLIVAGESRELGVSGNSAHLMTEADRQAEAILIERVELEAGAMRCGARRPQYVELYNAYIRKNATLLQSAAKRLQVQVRQVQVVQQMTVATGAMGTTEATGGGRESINHRLFEISENAALEAIADYDGFCERKFSRLQSLMAAETTGPALVSSNGSKGES